MLQNANTRCNGLLPLWGPQVAEAAFASCLAKHNAYLLEATRHRDIGYQSTIHDLKLLLLRFAQVGWIRFWFLALLASCPSLAKRGGLCLTRVG